MTIRHLEIFVTVCECGKMGLAAQKLYISQPTVSQAIAELENHYGTKLFERLSKKLYITAAGETLLSYARHVVAVFAEMDSSIDKTIQNVELKIGASITIATCILSDILKNYEHNNPQVRTQIFVDNTAVIEDKLLRSELDIGIVEGQIKSDAIITRPFYNDELVLVAGKTHPFYNQSKIRLTDLSQQAFILREKGSGTRELFLNELDKQQISIREKWTCNNSEAIKNAVIEGQGLTVISKMLVEKEVASQDLHMLAIPPLKLCRSFSLAYHKNKFMAEHITRFLAEFTFLPES